MNVLWPLIASFPAAFVQGQMFAGLFQDRMFLRLSGEHREEFDRVGGMPFEPMPGRPMREYATVPPAILRSKTVLRPWLQRAFEHARSLGPKKPRR